MNDKERSKILAWYENYCYSHKIASDLYDIQHKIDNTLTTEENINIIEEDLNKLIESDIQLNENLKQKIQQQNQRN